MQARAAGSIDERIGCSIGLAPTGRLVWDDGANADPSRFKRVARGFARDWREGLFVLAAEKIDDGGVPSIRFWRDIAEAYLTALCRRPAADSAADSPADPEIPAPDAATLGAWVDAAPPQRGGEYLSVERLADVWADLDAWRRGAMGDARDLEAFLEMRAPDWRHVGRVCFHLAENRADERRPFAFMATYAPGFAAGGRLRHVPLRSALEQYAGERNRAALLHLLQPIERAAQRCSWVAEIVESGEVYRPSAWTAARAHRFLRSIPALEASGLSVRVPDWWHARTRPQVRVRVETSGAARLGAAELLSFDLSVSLGDATLDERSLADLMRGDEPLVQVRGRWVEIDRDRLREALEHWRSVHQAVRQGTMTFAEGMRLLAGAPLDLRTADHPEQDRAWVGIDAGPELRRVMERLRSPGELARLRRPPGLRATLRPYQEQGVAWLNFITSLGLGACLADDMGLGKTVQVLALLAHRRRGAVRPSLLVVPASLLGNWRHEATRFVPDLRLRFLHPSEASAAELASIAADPRSSLADVDLAVTTYAMLGRQDWLAAMDWDLVVLDEAQAIRNAGTRQSKAARALRANGRIALTGTPIENRLGDLWSLFDFLNPGLLGGAGVFRTFVKRLEARETDRYGPLRRLVAPYVLRRMKTDRAIVPDLPEKTEIVQYCTLAPAQVRAYRQVVADLARRIGTLSGIERRGLVLQSILRLKQICNHPSQFSGDGAYEPEESGKFQRLGELAAEFAERQERALVFTQFREVIDPLAELLASAFGESGLSLHGGTTVGRRRSIVERFQADDGPPFLILSLKAGGTGLNLTAASQVVHFDRWWNPAVEAQATDRAFRIGQRRNVLVHKLVATGTIEERIDDLIASKLGLATEVLSDRAEARLTELSDEDLLRFVQLDTI